MSLITKSFTGVGNGGAIGVPKSNLLNYSVSGTFSGTAVLQKSENNGATWENVQSFTATGSGNFVVENTKAVVTQYRFICTARSSGTIVTSLYDISSKAVRVSASPAAFGHVGAGFVSGWLVPGTEIFPSAELPASKTGSEILIGFPPLKVGTKLHGMYFNGRLESGGNSSAFTFEPLYAVSEAGNITETTIPGGATTTVSGTADTLLSEANTFLPLNYVTKDTESYYVYASGTTGISAKVFLQNLTLLIEEP